MTTSKHNHSHLFEFEKKFRLADFFDLNWDKYVKKPSVFIEPEQMKAVNAIRVCRTAVLGVEFHVCEECGEISEIYHSCKNRFCPTCSWQDTLKWADKMSKQMLSIKHRHIVCTVPHDLHPLIKRNKVLLLGVLMRASAYTFVDWFKSKHNLKIGIIDVLHTFGERKNYHAHTHMIVSWGGIDIRTGRLKEINEEYVNYKFLQKKFRAKFEDELIQLNDLGKLEHDYKDRTSFMKFVKSINDKNWQIHLEPSMQTPTQVIRYIGRYSKRACLSEYKITNIDGEYLSFKYKDYKDRDSNGEAIEKIEKLHYSVFFPRLLQHVPPAYFRVVRYYGLYSNHGRIPDEYKSINEDNTESSIEYEDPLYCKICQRKKIHFYTYYDRRSRKKRKKNIRQIMLKIVKQKQKFAA